MAKVNTSTGYSSVKWVLVAVVVVVAVVLFRSMTGTKSHAGTPLVNSAATTIDDRIKPSGEVSIAAVARPLAALPDATPAANASSGGASPAPAAGGSSGAANKVGESTYNSLCMGCHASGALGSPKFGDKAAWAPRIAQGMDTLYNSALKGKKSMPAKGGNPGLSDADVKATVDYMVAAAK